MAVPHGRGFETSPVMLWRLWCKRKPGLPKTIADWHGEVEHIQTGRHWTFHTLDELMGFLRRRTGDPDVLGRQTVILPPTRVPHLTDARRQLQPLTATVSKRK